GGAAGEGRRGGRARAPVAQQDHGHGPALCTPAHPGGARRRDHRRAQRLESSGHGVDRMRTATVGRSGLRVSALGLGTLTWGRETPGDEAAAQLTAFVDAGGTLVDTSPAYNDGAAEAVLAELLGDVVARDRLVLSGTAGIDPAAPPGQRVDCSRRALLTGLDRTLTVLGTDHLDLWQVAAWDRRTPVAEVAATLAHAVRTGRARYVGVRGHLAWQLATAAGVAAADAPIVAAQAEYSLLARGAE